VAAAQAEAPERPAAPTDSVAPAFQPQTQSPRQEATPRIVVYGKWVAAAASAGFTALGIREHNDADRAFADLARYCRQQQSCDVGPDGRYLDPAAEERYQRVVSGDRRARTWLVTGQLALVGSVALFVIELTREKGSENIPYRGLLVEPGKYGTRIGFRLPW
jgi:hypothetical protein